MPDPSGEHPYQIPGTQPALEPSTLPGQPLTAARCLPLLAKVIA